MATSIDGVYTHTRRMVRSALIRRPVLNVTIGRVLRNIERLIPLTSWQLDDSGTVHCHNLTFNYSEADTALALRLRLDGDYEPETRQVIQTLLKPGMTFVDLGAHIGYFALLGAQAVTDTGRVFAFEPTPDTCRTLDLNCQANGLSHRIQVEPLAISDAPGTVRFVCEPSSTSNKIVADSTPSERVIEAECTSLDAYFESQGWPRVDLIKMDVEGAELAAFRGMAELSRRNPNLKLIFEYLHQHLEDHSVTPQMLFTQLTELGFTKFRVLCHKGWDIHLPDDLSRVHQMAQKENLNILAEK